MLNELKSNLGNVMRAYQAEGKQIPDDLWYQGCLIFKMEEAVKEGDEEMLLFLMNELVGGDDTAFTA
ncbi:hypothetical protein [Pseudomonas sp. HUK17]|uniref:hypothetical protein n=1 Tax=Pseudomonas sp. HUK17 TaxID=1799359 RepID=UPI00128F152E|nr:hypothetical protein [Pseudomonas sp. HUK17]